MNELATAISIIRAKRLGRPLSHCLGSIQYRLKETKPIELKSAADLEEGFCMKAKGRRLHLRSHGNLGS